MCACGVRIRGKERVLMPPASSSHTHTNHHLPGLGLGAGGPLRSCHRGTWGWETEVSPGSEEVPSTLTFHSSRTMEPALARKYLKNFECMKAGTRLRLICPSRQAPGHLERLLSLRAARHPLLTPSEVKGWGGQKAGKAGPRPQCLSRHSWRKPSQGHAPREAQWVQLVQGPGQWVCGWHMTLGGPGSQLGGAFATYRNGRGHKEGSRTLDASPTGVPARQHEQVGHGPQLHHQ